MQVQLGGAAQDDHCAVVSPGSGQQAEQRQYGGDGEDGEDDGGGEEGEDEMSVLFG